MSAARLNCVVDADFQDVGDQRRDDRRRSSDRRATRLMLYPAFAATLVNHVAPAEKVRAHGYAAQPKAPRAGITFDLRA